ncbi:MAG TPA: 30S ribosomal protein S18 [Dictyoglomaceae bacterium]|nr:30S ribosomal protein S18 [Dictyoglomaceae bacterium]HOL38960.1 30S ribosomal protein S18 [Dictyoglomaceae bacterium]HOP94852.1 30S ribosomal protein S18 [Dictyoglomaceae bacterium]HPP15623.1 30S ribosomal protein S18 [Dictyoglomaceae bacterium]HPU43510.1 30S ribosomal protein S18 [Dictyoglomaceae bacterium]
MSSGRTSTKSQKFTYSPPRRRHCIFCNEKVDYIDYKDIERLRRFMTDKGKIIPRRVSGVCARHQRQLSTAIKRARYMALLPYVVK